MGEARTTTLTATPGQLAAHEAYPRGVIVPGFIDCHAHLLLGGLTLSQLDLSRVSSRCEFEAAVEAAHRALPPGRWLQAHGWDEGRFGGSPPDRTWLRAAGSRPVVAYRMDQHACVVNDAVLTMLAGRPTPDGGEIVVGADCVPSGLMKEQAAWKLVNPLIPAPSIEEKRRAVMAAATHAARLGLTTICSMEYMADVQEVFEPLRDQLPVRLRITLLDREAPFDPRIADRLRGDDRLAVNGFKTFIDGTLGSRTARMLEAYGDDRDHPGNRGTLVELALNGTLREWAGAVIDHGLSPAMHVIGDEAIRVAIDAISPVDPQRLCRFEHAQTIHPADVARLGGRRLSMQPLHRAFDAAPAATRLGAARMNRFFPFRAAKDAGALIGFGSDWPIVDLDPIRGMHAAITGCEVEHEDSPGPATGFSAVESLAAYTADAARLLDLPRGWGTLGAGAPDDLVILDRDPARCDWGRERPRLLATMVGGRWTYRRSEP